MTNTDMELIMKGMSQNPQKNIQSFGLHDVRLESEGLNCLAAYLGQVNPAQFEEITLSCLNFTNLDPFCEMIKVNTYLKKLNIA